MRHHINRILGGILLISGTTIGAGMLALPVSTGIAGFLPSLLLFILYSLLMTFTGFLFLEVNLWFDGDINLVTMAEKTLGWKGKALAWGFYLFLLYALTTAYLAIGGPIFLSALSSLTSFEFPSWFGPMPLLLIFGYFVYKGTRSVDLINRVMMVALALTYFIVVFKLMPHVEFKHFEYVEWAYMPLGVSLVATSFGFHIIIPSLTTYLNHDMKKLKLTLIVGCSIPLVVYILWNFVALGVLPVEGAHGLLAAYKEGVNSSDLLAEAMNGTEWLSLCIRAMAFFAIITSFLGVSLSLLDFLADGIGIEKTRSGRLLLIALTFVPPLIFALKFTRVLFTALEWAGAFGVVTLLGILPACMVYAGRYHHGFSGEFKTPGGRFALVLTIIVSLLVILIELSNKLGWTHL